ncbi:hypothetical protein DM01DRAFT_1023432 [Hesseltinella vesiculosa]|uniref:Uncharacterized protein n=1 Tax=Hesseltinella vesiculosa TaxID=101127 RepID=A0A1X2GJZ7_9FUNG|nr:hypothetical protein DM01DRAFT_1023432 [Hesseltinella vesiculosa]
MVCCRSSDQNGSHYQSAAQSESATEILAAIQEGPLSVFKLMLDLRTVFGRCYLLLDWFGWQWQGTTLRLLNDPIQWQPCNSSLPTRHQTMPGRWIQPRFRLTACLTCYLPIPVVRCF